jgi:CubicO group peptidase (beta-lactamase class C family)
MTNSSYRFSDYQNARNKAALHVFENGSPVNRYVRDADAEAPAGGVSASARDLSQWLRLQLAGGSWNGQQIVETKALDETHQPIICAGQSTNGVCDPTVGYYGLGWDVSLDNNGRKTLSHSGAFLLGASTTVRFVPDENVGILVLSNTLPLGVPEAIALTFLDLFSTASSACPTGLRKSIQCSKK